MRSRSGEREKERGLRATRTHVEREIDIGERQRRREKTGKTNRKPTPEAGTREEPLGALSSNRASLETGGSIQTWTFRDSLVAFLFFFFSFPLLFLLFLLFFFLLHLFFHILPSSFRQLSLSLSFLSHRSSLRISSPPRSLRTRTCLRREREIAVTRES